MLLKAEMKDILDMGVVEKAKRMGVAPVGVPPVEDDIPF